MMQLPGSWPWLKVTIIHAVVDRGDPVGSHAATRVEIASRVGNSSQCPITIQIGHGRLADLHDVSQMASHRASQPLADLSGQSRHRQTVGVQDVWLDSCDQFF